MASSPSEFSSSPLTPHFTPGQTPNQSIISSIVPSLQELGDTSQYEGPKKLDKMLKIDLDPTKTDRPEWIVSFYIFI
jgi:hypothetical protein